MAGCVANNNEPVTTISTKAEKKIAKAEKKYEKRVLKEQERTRQRKNDKKEMIF